MASKKSGTAGKAASVVGKGPIPRMHSAASAAELVEEMCRLASLAAKGEKNPMFEAVRLLTDAPGFRPFDMSVFVAWTSKQRGDSYLAAVVVLCFLSLSGKELPIVSRKMSTQIDKVKTYFIEMIAARRAA